MYVKAAKNSLEIRKVQAYFLNIQLAATEKKYKRNNQFADTFTTAFCTITRVGGFTTAERECSDDDKPPPPPCTVEAE